MSRVELGDSCVPLYTPVLVGRGTLDVPDGRIAEAVPRRYGWGGRIRLRRDEGDVTVTMGANYVRIMDLLREKGVRIADEEARSASGGAVLCFHSPTACPPDASRSSTPFSSRRTSLSGSSTSCRTSTPRSARPRSTRAPWTARATARCRGRSAGSHRCSCTEAGITSSATCSSSVCSARTGGCVRPMATWPLRLGGLAATVTQTAMTLLAGTTADAQAPNLGASGTIAAVLGLPRALPNANVLRLIGVFHHIRPGSLFGSCTSSSGRTSAFQRDRERWGRCVLRTR